MIDPEQERSRLQHFYAAQLDGELEKVARQAYELTDLAREALREEIKRRNLEVRLVEAAPAHPSPPPKELPGDPPPELAEESVSEGKLDFRGLVTIRRFRDLPEALLAKGSLDSAGIESALVDENIVRLDWFLSNLMGGVKLEVDPEDVDAANEILNQTIPANFEVTGVGEYEQPQCPRCQSLDVTFKELNPVSYLTACLNVPIPLHRRAWRCHDCNVEWEDDGIPEPNESSA